MRVFLFMMLCVGSLSAQSISLGVNAAVWENDYDRGSLTWKPGVNVEAFGLTANLYRGGRWNVGYQFYFDNRDICAEGNDGHVVGFALGSNNIELSWGGSHDNYRLMGYIGIESNRLWENVPNVVFTSYMGIRFQYKLFNF